MPKSSKQVNLPGAAHNMAQQALDHLPAEHFAFDPASPTNLGGAATAPIDHVPEQAQSHVPTVIPPPVTLPEAAGHMSATATLHLPDNFVFNTASVGGGAAASQPIDHVPDQAAPHVPEVVPPDFTLPPAATEHMSDVAKDHLALHTDWFV